MTEITITSENSGLSVEAFIQQQMPAVPSGYLRQLTRKGKLLLNRQVCTGQELLRQGDVLSLPPSQRLAELIQQSQQEQIQVLLEGPDFLAVYKPAGLAVHRCVGHETDNLGTRVNNWLKRRKLPYSALPVHRLDIGTSGPLLFAKGRRAAGVLGNFFMTGQVEKHYLALVSGNLSSRGELNSPVPAKGKLCSAVTRYRVLACNRYYSLLQLELISGRKHQIRRQLADADHPLIGDQRYGGPILPGGSWPFLHCCYLAWPGSPENQKQAVSCPLPHSLQQLLHSVDLSLPES